MKAFEQRGSAIVKRLAPNAMVAEVGVLLGVLSEYILRSRSDVDVLMIDSWRTADKHPEHYRATGDEHANHEDPKRVLRHRREAEGRARLFPGRAHIMAMTSLQAARSIKDKSLDMVFLDADHSYLGVKSDLAAWVPKVKHGGWIGGHDYANREAGYDFSGVDRAVNEWASAWGVPVELDLNFTWFARP